MKYNNGEVSMFAGGVRACRLNLAFFFLIVVGIVAALFERVPVVHAESAESTSALPRLRVDGAVFDFGKVPEGIKVERSFTLSNVGTGPLKIERLYTSCGCTAAVVESPIIEAGKDTQLKVSFDTSGFSGAKVKTARIYTNDPKSPSIVFTLQGVVEPDVLLSTDSVNFGDVRKGQQAVQTLTVRAKDASTQIQAATTRSAHIKVEKEELSSGSVKFNLSLKNTAPLGIFRERLSIKTSSSHTPVVNVGIFARIIGNLKFSPSAISFGLLKGPLTEPVSSTVKFEYVSLPADIKENSVLRILSVESDNPSIVSEVVKLSDGNLGIKVTLQPSLSGAFRARVKVVTNNPDSEQREMILPVYGIVSPKI